MRYTLTMLINSARRESIPYSWESMVHHHRMGCQPVNVRWWFAITLSLLATMESNSYVSLAPMSDQNSSRTKGWNIASLIACQTSARAESEKSGSWNSVYWVSNPRWKILAMWKESNFGYPKINCPVSQSPTRWCCAIVVHYWAHVAVATSSLSMSIPHLLLV